MAKQARKDNEAKHVDGAIGGMDLVTVEQLGERSGLQRFGIRDLLNDDRSGQNVPIGMGTSEAAVIDDDYGLDRPARRKVYRLTSGINRLISKSVIDLLRIGGQLCEVQAVLARGRTGAWKAWLAKEPCLHPKMANRIINSYRRLVEKVGDQVAGGIEEYWGNFSPTAFYALGQKNLVDDELLDQLIDCAKNGEKVTPKKIEGLLGENASKPVTREEPEPMPLALVKLYMQHGGYRCVVRMDEADYGMAIGFIREDELDTPASPDFDKCNFNALGDLKLAEEIAKLPSLSSK